MNRTRFVATLTLLASVCTPALAADYTGTVSWIGVWDSGNVAFELATSTPSCNGQFIPNASSAGFKNFYAALLAAQSRGAAIRVVTSGCGPATDTAPATTFRSISIRRTEQVSRPMWGEDVHDLHCE